MRFSVQASPVCSSCRRIFLTIALLLSAVSLTPAAEHDLIPGQTRLVLLDSGKTSTWDLKISEPSIIWFFASTGDSDTGLTFTGPPGRTGNPLWIRPTESPGNATVTLAVTSSGSPVKTRVWAEMETEFDPAEPNDTFASATTLPPAGEAPFYLFPDGDQDWFAFRIDAPGEHRIEVRSRDGRLATFSEGLELGICDAQERPLVQRVGSTEDTVAWQPPGFDLEPGDYRCWVRARGGVASRTRLLLGLQLPSPAVAMPPPPQPAPSHQVAQAPRPAPQHAASPHPPAPAGKPPAKAADITKPGTGPWPWIVVAAFGIGAVWFMVKFARPRRVFDLTG